MRKINFHQFKQLCQWKPGFADIPDDYMDSLYGKTYNGFCHPRDKVSKQTTFDVCAEHMLNQGRRSAKKGLGNLYNGPRGLKCPVRLLIPTEVWDKEEMEHRSCDAGIVYVALNRLGYDPDFCKELQKIHDTVKPSMWPRALDELARKHGILGIKKEWIRTRGKKNDQGN